MGNFTDDYDLMSLGLGEFIDYSNNQQEVNRRRQISSDNSIGAEKRTSTSAKKKKNARAIRVKAIIGSAILSLSIYGGITLKNVIVEKAEYVADTKEAVALSEELMTERLVDSGVAHYEKDGRFSIKGMSVADYGTLSISSPEELYALIKVIDDETECDNMVRAMTYTDTEGNVCNYTDFAQFLRVNGYFNKDNKADTEVFDNLCESSLVSSYRAGTINELFEEAPGRGGMNK